LASQEADHFYEEIYLQSSRHLFTEGLADHEAALMLKILAPRPSDLMLDLGCGDGRHLSALARAGHAEAVGVDRSESSLQAGRTRDPSLALVRGDYRALPFLPGSFNQVFVWYAALFVLEDDAAHEHILRQVYELLAPGGAFLHDGANPAALAREPLAEFEDRLPDGSFVQERCEWRPSERREHGFRRLLRPSGKVVEGAWATRHYSAAELGALLRKTGFEVECLLDERGRDFDEAQAQDLVILARKG